MFSHCHGKKLKKPTQQSTIYPEEQQSDCTKITNSVQKNWLKILSINRAMISRLSAKGRYLTFFVAKPGRRRKLKQNYQFCSEKNGENS